MTCHNVTLYLAYSLRSHEQHAQRLGVATTDVHSSKRVTLFTMIIKKLRGAWLAAFGWSLGVCVCPGIATVTYAACARFRHNVQSG